jgi:hypothetical protein
MIIKLPCSWIDYSPFSPPKTARGVPEILVRECKNMDTAMSQCHGYIQVFDKHAMNSLTANLDVVVDGKGFSRKEVILPCPSTSAIPHFTVSGKWDTSLVVCKI